MHLITVGLASGQLDYLVEDLTESFVCPFSGLTYEELNKTEVDSGIYNNLLCVGNDDVDAGVAHYQKLIKTLPFAPMFFEKKMEVLSVTKGLTPFFNFTGFMTVPWRSSKTKVTTSVYYQRDPHNNGVIQQLRDHSKTTHYSGTASTYYSKTVAAACSGALTASLQKGDLDHINLRTSKPFGPDSLNGNHNCIMLIPYEDFDSAYSRLSSALDSIGRSAAKSECKGTLTSYSVNHTVDSAITIMALTYIINYKYKGNYYVGLYVPASGSVMGNYPESKAQKNANGLITLAILAFVLTKLGVSIYHNGLEDVWWPMLLAFLDFSLLMGVKRFIMRGGRFFR